MVDIIDKLQAAGGKVKLKLKSGKTIIGVPTFIVFDEDENGWETVKKIRFKEDTVPFADYYGLDDLVSFEKV